MSHNNMDINKALSQAKNQALLEIAERCKHDLFYLCKYILGYDLMTEFTHQELCDYTSSLISPHSTQKDTVGSQKPGINQSQSTDTEKNYYTNIDVQPIEIPDVSLKNLENSSNPGISGTDSEIDVQGIHDQQQDQYDPRKNQLLLLMPRGTFKSSVVTIGFALQFMLNDPDCRILIDSETFSKAKAFLAEIKGHLEANDKFRDVYKTLFGDYPDAKAKKDMWSDSGFNVSARKLKRKEPTFSCAGVDVTKNGMHYDLIIMDDLHSELNTQNKDQIDKVVQHYKLAFSLLDPGKPLIVIGTRWDYNDVYQHILDNEADNFNIMVRKAILDDGSLLFPERLTPEFLDKVKKTQGSYIFSCTPAGTPILMADWTFKPVEEVQENDEVIGYENDGNRTVLVKTRVTGTGSRKAPVQAVRLDNGKVIRCTPDHEWFTGRKDATHRPYKPATVGGYLKEVTSVPLEARVANPAEWGYLAGMIDGEGALNHGSIAITQSEEHNPGVCARIEKCLGILGLPYKKYETRPNQYQWVLNGGKDTKIKLLNTVDLGKKDKLVKNLWNHARRPGQSKHKIIDIQPLGEDRVYSFQTETGNYVAYGMMSKNCQYLNQPVDNETATFKLSTFQTKPWELVKDLPINWFLSVDPSFEGPYSDYAAFVVAGMDFQRNLYVRHILRAKMTYASIIEQMFYLYTQFKPKEIVLETVATQKSLQYMLNDEQKRRGMWLPVKEIKGRNKSKEERIRGLAPYYEFGRIFHVKECNQRSDLEYELIHFPKGTHDDIIDALATILEVATPGTHASPERTEKRQKLIDVLTKPRSGVTGV